MSEPSRRSEQYDALLSPLPSPSLSSAGSSRARRSMRDFQRASSGSQYDASLMTRRESALPPSISSHYEISPDPSTWGAVLTMDVREDDDYLHNPDPKADKKADRGGSICSGRGLLNIGCLLFLVLGLLTLFAGYPLASHLLKKPKSYNGGFSLGGINKTGQVPSMPGNWGLIDLDTPPEARTKLDYVTGQQWQLVWSDEFNVEGRTFYPGDDPYWEAVDLHYWQTGNIEWYDPSALMTRNGSLEVTLSATPNHERNYTGGMMATWNKFCFTGGLIETAVVLPGANNVLGLWPAIWLMGNLGRAGYGASLEGMWPYTYDACDVGTVANQTVKGEPVAATVDGDPSADGVLSYLPGQRLSRCTCPGESHPGPVHADGTFVGRAAPEIDIFEALVSGNPPMGRVSQSCQLGPFNAKYEWFNTPDNMIIENSTVSQYNGYKGGKFQQAASVVTQTNQEAYELSGNTPSVYGLQYKPGFDDAYISWITDGKHAWTMRQAGLAADTRVEIDARPVPQEPLYIIINLGMSNGFGDVDFDHLTFPTVMKVDWVRVYQDPNAINIGCDPAGFPTMDYIKQYERAYTDANLTTWKDDYHQSVPKNSFLGQC